MNIDNEILALVEKLREEYKIPSYTYNSFDKFIKGVTPIYYSGAYFDDKEVVASVKAMLIGKWMSAGENVREFEKAFSRKINQQFSCMVNSGSSANLIMISALKKYFGWEDGDEIIVSVVGFPTTVSVISQCNLKPVFIDIELDTLNFDLQLIPAKVTPKTRAIFLSPVLGNPPDMDMLVRFCEFSNIKLILDNCDSLGSKWDGKFLNEYAVASSCSFYAAHTICTFEGGMVSSNDGKLMKIVRSMTNWGRGCTCSGVENLLPNGICNHRFDNWLEGYDGVIDHKYVFTNMGYNLKPLDVCGAVGLVQLEKLDEICEKRKLHKRLIGDIFERRIKGVKTISGWFGSPRIEDSRKDDTVWFGTPVICKTKQLKQDLVSHLEKNHIQTRNYFAGNILMHPAYKHLGDYKDYPNANTVLDTVFFVGASPAYTEEVINYIEEVLTKFYE